MAEKVKKKEQKVYLNKLGQAYISKNPTPGDKEQAGPSIHVISGKSNHVDSFVPSDEDPSRDSSEEITITPEVADAPKKDNKK